MVELDEKFVDVIVQRYIGQKGSAEEVSVIRDGAETAYEDLRKEGAADDVTKLRPGDVPYADIWCFGFPCQDISIAGKQRGLSGKRSGIYYNILDLIKGKE